MSSINRVKKYIENSSYHIYNRGVNKRKIFFCEEDYRTYLKYLKQYLLPKDVLYRELLDEYASPREIVRVMSISNFANQINLQSYCLMPNHIHLLVEQTEAKVISKFMKSLHTRYSMYINAKYKRIGGLFQDIYKARCIRDPKDLLNVSLYIHRNPIKLTHRLETYRWSSLQYFVNNQKILWIKKEKVNKAFQNSLLQSQYKNYVDLVKDQHEEGWSF